MQLFLTGLVRVVSVLSFATLCGAPGAAAQSFEENEWRFVASNPAPEKPLLSTDWLSRDPNDSEIMAELVDNTYPTNLSAADLNCDYDRTLGEVFNDTSDWMFGEPVVTEFDVTKNFVDEVLSRFAHAASWLDEQGFAPIHTSASMPEYRRDEDTESGEVTYEPTGKTINLVGCDPANAYFATLSQSAADGSNPVRFGHSAAELREANELAFRLSAVHEFMHIYTNNFSDGFGNGVATPHWVSEGIPDAIAIRYVADELGGYSSLLADENVGTWRPEAGLPYGYYKRFYLARPYFVPLNLTAAAADEGSSIYRTASSDLIGAVTDKDYRLMGYITDGFWTHVMERYLDDEPSRFHSLLQSIGEGDLDRLLQRTDEWLDVRDGSMTGIEHVFPQFLAEYEGWWVRDQADMSEDRWLDYGFNGCEEIEIDLGNTAEVREIEVALNAGRCIDVILSSYVAQMKPTIDIAVFTQDEPEVANHLYLALARARNADTVFGASHQVGPDWSCYESVNSGVTPRGGCLLHPEQGGVEWSGSGQSVTARTFSVVDVGNSGVRNVRLRFILAYVDSRNVEVGTYMSSKQVNFVVATTQAEMEEKSDSGAKSLSRRQSPRGETVTTVRYGLQAQGMGIATNRGAAAGGGPDFGIMNLPGVAEALEEAREQGPLSLQVITERPDGTIRDIAFLLEDKLEVGETGPVPFMGIMGGEGGADLGRKMYFQDPDNPSELYIEEHTDYTLRFRGRANVCAVTGTGLMATIRAQSGDPCRERLSLSVRGAIGFPGIASGETPFTYVSTPELEAYEQLREARIAGYLGSSLPGPSQPPDRSGSPTPGGPGSSGPGGGHAPDYGGQCSVPIANEQGVCDCSCDASACLQTRGEAGTATPPEMFCAMQCARDWAMCDAR